MPSQSSRWSGRIGYLVVLAIVVFILAIGAWNIISMSRPKPERRNTLEQNMRTLDFAVRDFAEKTGGHFPGDINVTVGQVLTQLGITSIDSTSLAGAGPLDPVRRGDIGSVGPALLRRKMGHPFHDSLPAVTTSVADPPSWSEESAGTVFYVPLIVEGKIATAYRIYGAGEDSLIILILSSED